MSYFGFAWIVKNCLKPHRFLAWNTAIHVFLRSSICWVILLPYAWTIPKKLLNIWRTGFDLQKNSTSVSSWLDNPSHTSMSSFGDFMVTTRDYHCTMNHCHEWQLVTASYHDLSWSIMIHSDLSWSIVIYHDPSWTILIYCVHIIFSGRMKSLSIGWNGVPRNGIDPPPAFVTRPCGCGSGIGFPFFHGVIPIAGWFTLW